MMAMSSVPKYYDENRRRNIYLACENMDFTWCEDDVCKFDQLWQEGKSIWEIAKEFDRDPDEVVILIIDRVREGHIKKRKNGVLGHE